MPYEREIEVPVVSRLHAELVGRAGEPNFGDSDLGATDPVGTNRTVARVFDRLFWARFDSGRASG